MHIGIDARMYGPKQTGIGNYTQYLIEHLARIDKKNTYYIFLRKESYSKFKIQNSKFYNVLSDYPWYSFSEQTLFLKTLIGHPLDVMHFPHFNVPLLYNKPFIATIHDLTPKYFPGEKVGNSWFRRKAYDAVLWHAVKKSRAIITPSQAVKNDILKHFSISPQKINVIYEGIPYMRIKSQNEFHHSFGMTKVKSIEKYEPYILYVGVWRSHKNLKGLIDAFALLKKEGVPHKLVIVGEPDIYYNDVSAHWKRLGLEGEIIATGFQSDDMLIRWYQNASLAVLPSFQEGFGLTPLQALSLGVPVAVSDIPVLREILRECAFYFNPNDPEDMARVIKEALQDRNAVRKKVSASPLHIKKYTWEEMARQTLTMYETTCNH